MPAFIFFTSIFVVFARAEQTPEEWAQWRLDFINAPTVPDPDIFYLCRIVRGWNVGHFCSTPSSLDVDSIAPNSSDK